MPDGDVVDISFDPSLISTPKPRKARTVKPSPVEDESFENPGTFVGISEASKPVRKGRAAGDIRTIEQGLTQAFGMAGLGVSMWNQYDGLVIGLNAEALAKQWSKVAENNPAVKKWLLRVLQGGDMAGAIMVTVGVGVAIAANHDVIDPKVADLTGPIGVKLPSVESAEFISNGNGNHSTS